MDDRLKDEVKDLCRKWRGPVLRGDCTPDYAAQEIAGHFCTPYLPQGEYSHIRDFALKRLPKSADY